MSLVNVLCNVMVIFLTYILKNFLHIQTLFAKMCQMEKSCVGHCMWHRFQGASFIECIPTVRRSDRGNEAAQMQKPYACVHV